MIEATEKSLETFSNLVDRDIHGIEIVINSFNNEQIVDSFYASGKFGQEQKERLEKILLALRKYKGAIIDDGDSLVNQTKLYLKRQMDLVQTGTTSE